jgi:hypothetical protein
VTTNETMSRNPKTPTSPRLGVTDTYLLAGTIISPDYSSAHLVGRSNRVLLVHVGEVDQRPTMHSDNVEAMPVYRRYDLAAGQTPLPRGPFP